ncbi:hypothetical protein NC661_17990 [Aquibacillus koreensis]|uniref:Uncharacterized protein n=1 Tax=Aquibacillus koreensis TaxID=279446 RepID=A0A9X4AJW4_9BACI|nr:hypothetical protein [Aquibacillus koreensis]MCT2535409.1 hypothetical protein [Aquibacillus koreensis]MDC3422244.1 hypothetical protein [Aquibacillus koreensis]
MILELLRIIFIIAILGTVLDGIPHAIYTSIGIDTDKYGWISMFGVFIFIFVLYRNKLQFSGWYTGKGREKLPGVVSKTLLLSAILLLLSPPILHFLLN